MRGSCQHHSLHRYCARWSSRTAGTLEGIQSSGHGCSSQAWHLLPACFTFLPSQALLVVSGATAGRQPLVARPLPFCKSWQLRISQQGLHRYPHQPPGSPTSLWQVSRGRQSEAGEVRQERGAPGGAAWVSPVGAPDWANTKKSLMAGESEGKGAPQHPPHSYCTGL